MSDYSDITFDCDLDPYDNLDYDQIKDSIKDDVDMEKLLYAIRKARQEVEFLKKLKDKRVKPIDAKIKKLNDNEDRLRDYILSLMDVLFPNKNSVDFPGVGKITKRKVSGKWVVEDEDKFYKLVEDNNLSEDAIRIKKSVNKKKLPSVVARLMAELETEELDGIKFEEPDNDHSLALKIYEEVVEEDDTNNVGF
ncbi:MAG: host-nuclease inhibitor Gam family protein [bacterium]